MQLFMCFAPVPLLSPENLRASEEWYNRFRVTWDPPQSMTVGYKILYQPVHGRNMQQICKPKANKSVL